MADGKRQVWYPALYDKRDIRAIQTLALYAKAAEYPFPPGEEPPAPSPMDVKRALDWIIHGAAQTYENGFVANDANGRTAAFIDGRRSVGQQIIKLMQLKPEALDKDTQ